MKKKKKKKIKEVVIKDTPDLDAPHYRRGRGYGMRRSIGTGRGGSSMGID